MTDYAAAGDTWGVSDPMFLLMLWTAIAVTVLATVAYTQLVSPTPAPVDPDVLEPPQAAYLMGGPLLAIYATLAWLRNGGAIGLADRGLVTTGPAPAGGTPLDHAVYQAAQRRTPPHELIDEPGVARTIAEIRADFQRAGLVKTARVYIGWWIGFGVLEALFVLAIVRLIASHENSGSIDWFLLMSMVALQPLAIWVMVGVGMRYRTFRAGLALRELRARNRHLDPANRPAWETYGPAGAAMGVALFGGAALWAMDRTFAADAGVSSETASVVLGATGASKATGYGYGGG